MNAQSKIVAVAMTAIAGSLITLPFGARPATAGASANSFTIAPIAATDPRIDSRIRPFLAQIDKNASPYWELPTPQVEAVLTNLQNQTPVDMSGVTISEVTIGSGTTQVKLHVMKPQNASGNLPVILFIHGGVWLAGNFENHKRFVRDLVVGSGAAAVFVDYTQLPKAVFPTQLEQSYNAAKWVVSSGSSYGLDGSRMVVAGNSVGGCMTAALTLLTKDRGGPKFKAQILFWPATDTNFDTNSYREFGTGRFLARAFMQYGWNIYAPSPKTRQNRYAVPMRATEDQLRGLPPALVITGENDPLRDEGEAYARKLDNAGVQVVATRYNGTIHDFILLNAIRNVPSTQAALAQATATIRAAVQQ